ncbi:MAG: hypothetical protein IT384_17260 [Deltaproteobacteria bacterium]|nr:hypothetical protein [Deltaproteobacteria bacterium]
MPRAVTVFLPALIGASACGYQLGAATGVQNLAVHVEDQRGLDVDAEALVAGALRRTIARGPGTSLAPDGEEEATLRVQLIDARSGLSPLADPSLRAAQYRAEIRVVATLLGSDGRVLWRSSVLSGEASYLSRPGGLEVLDGARRSALARAAEDVAERLRASLAFGR